MGFPVGYSELLLPKLLLHIGFLLGLLRRLISWAFDTVGLSDLVDYDAVTWPDPPDPPTHAHQSPVFLSVSAMLIQQLLPVIRFGELLAGREDAGHRLVADACAVCLYEFEPLEEVRRLSNCRHVFHRCCLDRWMEHDQRTCPLCRTPLIPEEMLEALDHRKWTAAGVPERGLLPTHSITSDLLLASPAAAAGGRSIG